MAVPVRHVLRQGANLEALVRAGFTALQSKGSSGGSFTTPGPVFASQITPPPADLVADYIRHVGGDARAYRGTVPHHLFPQWAFGDLSKTLKGVPYDVSKVLNGGVELACHGPLPAKGPWQLTTCLVDIDEDDKRVLFRQRVTTGPASQPDALVAHVNALIPKRAKGPKGPKAPPKTVPTEAREVARWRLASNAGFEFALLTGDFNPIHWIAPAGRAAGFKGCILHGFSTMARAIEGLNQAVYAGRIDRIASVEVRFARPVPLPSEMALFVGPQHDFYIGKALGAPAALIGSYVPQED